MNTMERGNYSLIGIDGNAYAVMGYVAKCMKKEHCSEEEIKKYYEDAQSGDYANLLCVSSAMIDKLNGGQDND